MINKKLLKKELVHKYLTQEKDFYIVLSANQPKYLKICKEFSLPFLDSIIAKQKNIPKSNVYITNKTCNDDKVILFIRNNECFFSNQLISLDEKNIKQNILLTFSFFIKFYYILKIISLK